MEFLNSLSTRDALEEVGMEVEADGPTRPKQKRVINLEEEEEEPVQKKAKTTNLGLNLQDDFFEVEAIQKRPLPREDGREWSFWEQTAAEEAKRPYGKKYLQEQSERQKILSRDKDYRFANELAGALRKELGDIVDPEDMARLSRERELERAETDIELKRTRIGASEKYDLVQKLKRMIADEQARLDSLRDRQPPYDLRLLSRYLVDNSVLPSAATTNRYYGLLDLLSLYGTYGGNESARIKERDLLATEELANDDVKQKSEEWLDLFFYLFVYYRDFLNNETAYSLTDSITEKLTYALDNSGTLSADNTPIKKEGGEAASLVLEYEDLLDRLGFYESNPLRELRVLKDQAKGLLVDWDLYRKRQTETVDMTYFERMNIPRSLEAEMASIGARGRYGEAYSVYTKKVIAYLYGTADERVQALRGTDGLNLFRDDSEDEVGNPFDISTLIQIQFPTYKTTKPEREIETLLRSHFLWLFFEDTPWREITDLLMPARSIIVESIARVMTPLRSVLASTLLLYKAITYQYLLRILRLFAEQKIIGLTPSMQTLLRSPSTGTVEGDAALFDRLNAAFKATEVRDLLQDELFYRYVISGINAFTDAQRNVNPFNTVDVLNIAQPAKLLVDPEYPALILHSLLRAYEQYIREYTTVVTNNIANISLDIEKANQKIAQIVGDESYTVGRNAADYRQRKSFTTLPENSGFIKMRSEIVYLLRQAYHYVMDYAPALRDLPLDAFQSDSAYETGLSTDFIGVVAVLAADREFSFPDGYRTGKQYTKIKQDKQGMMARMRRYCWESNYGKGYTIFKDRGGDMGTRPFFACRQTCQSIGSQLMF